MKTEVIVQVGGSDITVSEVEKQVKEAIKAQGVKVKDILEITTYVKPNENEVYYAAKLAGKKSLEGKL